MAQLLIEFDRSAPAAPRNPTPSPVAHRRRDWIGEVERELRRRGIPYVSVDEAKRALFSNASLRAFHYVVYQKEGANWLLWVGKPTKEVRDDMAEWGRIFGEDFRVVYAVPRASSIGFRAPDGQILALPD